ncbi:XisI protein [bacterium]|nr:XisI protein [bacterium]
MDRLNTLLKTCLEGYTGRALNGYSYLTSSADDRKHTIISVGQLPDKRIVDASLIVHVAGDRIVIERDVNDRPLVDALQQAGVERQQIILAYAGEPIDEPVA